MSDSTKALIGTIAGLAALVASIAIMSDCSKKVASIGGTRAAECVQSGGKWVPDLDGGVSDSGTCERAK